MAVFEFVRRCVAYLFQTRRSGQQKKNYMNYCNCDKYMYTL